MKLWEKAYSLDKKIEEFTVGDDYILDQKLVKYDCIASIAYAKMLCKQGILTKKEEQLLTSELNNIIALEKEGKFQIKKSDEDCHTAIENYLTKQLGEAGKKIHTGRSRNEQVLAALRLYYKEELRKSGGLINDLTGQIKKFCEKYGDTSLPGYTHFRKAMPSTIGMWAGSFEESLNDSKQLIGAALSLTDQCPLGTGAGYGSPIGADQEFLAKKLGFSKPQKNPIHCQSSRGKYESTILHALGQVMADLNKLASDLILFTMPEFSFFELPAELCTGSSLMPQKKNPDALELLRAKYHTVLAMEFQVKSLGLNLPSGYNRDVQLTKGPVISGFETAQECLEVACIIFAKLKVNKEKCEKALTEEVFATEKLHDLVKEGVPFRDAYKKISKNQ